MNADLIKLQTIQFESGISFANLFPIGHDEQDIFCDMQFFSRGRDALTILARRARAENHTTVLVPDLACEEIYRPFIAAGFELLFYRVTENLTPDLEHLATYREKCRLIVLVNYFGFIQRAEITDFVRNLGMAIIEDGTHSFMSKGSGLYGDYYFASLRKLLPLPDGAILKKKENLPDGKYQPSLAMRKFRICRAAGMLSVRMAQKKPRRIYRWLTQECFSAAEKFCNGERQVMPISRVSKKMAKAYCYAEIGTARKRNFEVLSKAFMKIPEVKIIHPVLPEGAVPYGFPVLVDKRMRWVYALDRLNVQAAPLWPRSDLLPEGHRGTTVGEKILVFPLGQDYSEDHMTELVLRIAALCK
jgi:hypothetical protein